MKITNRQVLIVGTKPSWEPALRKSYQGKVEFAFFNDPNGSTGLSKVCQRVDRVVLNSNLARHSHQSVIRGSHKPMEIVSGSLSSIKRALDHWLAEEEETPVD